jgi:hypothetical protein
MICGSCKIDRLVTDFMYNHKFCYGCVYREKLTKTTGKRTGNCPICRTCNKQFTIKKNQRTRQRTVFCSHECAEKGHKKQLKNHWTRKVRSKQICLKKEK